MAICSCSKSDKFQIRNFKLENEVYEMTNGAWDNIQEFKYKGHEYIKFSKHYQSGVVHSPDCENVKLINMSKPTYNEAAKMFDIVNAYLCEVFNIGWEWDEAVEYIQEHWDDA